VRARENRWRFVPNGSVPIHWATVSCNLIALMAAQLRALEERFCEMVRLKVPTRVARTITRLCADYGVAQREGMLIRFSREEIAQIAGTTMFAVSRLLSEWERLGLVKTMRQAIVVIDHHGLSEFTEAA
jgi:CRP/FNR family transcriptional regulator, nitrogen oxide reductase regulator